MTGADYRKKQAMSRTDTGMTENKRKIAHNPLSYSFLKILILLLGVLLLWGLLSFGAALIPLTKVEVEGLTQYAEEEILVASGLGTSEKLLDIDRESAVQALTTRYPYIASARIRYAFPLGYRVIIEEEVPVYYTCIADDYFALSADLKVLERAFSPRRYLEQGLQQISLGGVKSVMLGQTLCYDGDYLDRVLEDIGNSVLADRVTDVHIGDRYHLSVVCDEIYTLFLGDIHSIDAKIRLASLMMRESNVPDGYRAVLDVSDLKKTSIRFEGIRDTALSVAE